MIIVYNSNTGEIVGHCSRVFDSCKWREATIDELFSEHATSGLAALRAGGETVAVVVTATAPGYRPGNLNMEFVPAQTTRAKHD
jgi:hypothetical protein